MNFDRQPPSWLPSSLIESEVSALKELGDDAHTHSWNVISIAKYALKVVVVVEEVFEKRLTLDETFELVRAVFLKFPIGPLSLLSSALLGKSNSINNPQKLSAQQVAELVQRSNDLSPLLGETRQLLVTAKYVDERFATSVTFMSIKNSPPETIIDEPRQTIVISQMGYDLIKDWISLRQQRAPGKKTRSENPIGPDDLITMRKFGESKGYKDETKQRNTSAPVTIAKLIRAKPRYTGIITSSERHAMQIFEMATAAGLRIPTDLSLVTFHNRNNNAYNWSGPGIDFEEMGRIAVRLLNGKTSAIQHVRVKAQWNRGATMV